MIKEGRVVTNLFGKHGVEKGSSLYVVEDGEVLGTLNVTQVFNDEEYPFSFAVPKTRSLIGDLTSDMAVHTTPPNTDTDTNNDASKDQETDESTDNDDE